MTGPPIAIVRYTEGWGDLLVVSRHQGYHPISEHDIDVKDNIDIGTLANTGGP